MSNNERDYTTIEGSETLIKGVVSMAPEGSSLRVRTAGLENISDILNQIKVGVLDEDADLKNQFLTGITNVMTKSYLVDNSKLYTVMSRFYRDDTSSYGSYIREVFFDLPSAEVFDYNSAENENVFKKTETKAYEDIHVINARIRIPLTISDEELVKVVSSIQEFTAWLNGLKSAIKLKADLIEEDYLRRLLSEVYKNTASKKVAVGTFTDNRTFAESLIENITNYSYSISVKNEYNLAGATKMTPVGNQVVILRKEALTKINLYKLAEVFNLPYASLNTQVLVIDTFGEGMDDVQAVLLDEEAVIYRSRLNTLNNIYNPKGLYTNFFYHKHDIIDVSKFRPIVFMVSLDEVAEPVLPEEDPEGTEETP